MNHKEASQLLEFIDVYTACDLWGKTRIELKMVELFLLREPRSLEFAARIFFTVTCKRFLPLLLALILAVLILAALVP